MRRKIKCKWFDVEHIADCEVNPQDPDACACGCDIEMSCVDWKQYSIALDKEYGPPVGKNRRRTLRGIVRRRAPRA